MAENKKFLDSILSDQEQLAIQMFYDNNVQREAVRKVLLSVIYNNGTLKKGDKADPLRNLTLGLVSNAEALKLSDADLGSHLRSAWEGIQLVEQGFDHLAIYKKEEERSPTKNNPAV